MAVSLLLQQLPLKFLDEKHNELDEKIKLSVSVVSILKGDIQLWILKTLILIKFWLVSYLLSQKEKSIKLHSQKIPMVQ